LETRKRILCKPEANATKPNFYAVPQFYAYDLMTDRPISRRNLHETISPPDNPGIWLINLAILAAATCLCVDPWCTTEGYIQFIALHHWHLSFGLAFPSFLQLVQTELQEARLHSEHDHNPFNIQQE
jgi:hypothetical protein